MLETIRHAGWVERGPQRIDGYSLEMTAKDLPSLVEAARAITPGTPIAVTFLPGEAPEGRVAAAVAVRRMGFDPMPHFSARRISSAGVFEDYLGAAVQKAGVTQCFVVAGDPAKAEGPFDDSLSLIETGTFERHGIEMIGIGGHPEGHPHMTEQQCWDVLALKCAAIEQRGMEPLIVTQFAFDADLLIRWLTDLRRRGIDAPVRIGIPGPAGIKTLIRFAARCGVGASTAVLAKYGISITQLFGSTGPDKLVNGLLGQLEPEHGTVRLHFYPFGGLKKTIDWINDYTRSR